ncbi:unnamed protein product [Ranitomeya imitator]|uniref:Uncharacterized protein n=1 Tax=Ranitomeya imitator TaxID=111125 RepID=A0ABN9LCM1_9NEOB|nr:unnamed protein product [Ranitomeya imitator]
MAFQRTSFLTEVPSLFRGFGEPFVLGWALICLFSSAFHPQTNGQTERTNQTLETYLGCFVSADQDDWVSFLPLAEFALNNRASSATLVSPFFCNSGFHPRFSLGQVESSDCPGVDTVVDRLQQIWTHVVDNLTLSQEKAQRFANRRRCVGPRLRVGDLVWLSSRYIPMKVSSPKFKPRFIGPYRISEVLNPVSFRLTLPASFSIHNVFHRSLLRRYVAPVVPSIDPPAPVLVEGELEYIVEKILDSRVSRRKLQYLVKWKGYGQEDNSWVFASDVHAADLVRAFHVAHPGRPGGSGTDINAAILAAASIFNQTLPKLERGGRKQKIPLIIFLTDGEATSGVTASTRILQNAQKALKGTISLFCLAFGEDADYSLMRRLSLENRGIARRIYEYSDATLQLKGFYDEIASPLLFDIELAYIGETAQNVTQTLFPNYFDGSELVVTGKLKSGSKNLQVRMTAHDQKEKISLENDITLEDNATQSSFGCSGNVDEIQWFVQRLWAYFTIQDLLQARFKANDTIARKILTEKATNLSLKYNFVTPVTSLIIVKPDDPYEPKTTPATTTSTTSMPSTATQLTAMPSRTTASPPSIPPVKAKATTVTRLTKQANKTSRTPAKLSTTRPTTSSQSTISQVAETRGQAIVSTGTTTAGVLGKITTMATGLCL